MPKAYIVISSAQITDIAGFAEYRKAAGPTVQPYGGRPIVAADSAGRWSATKTFERLEGDLMPERLVILEFDNLEQAREWYHSQEYGAAIPLRQESAVSDVILVEGLS